MRFPSINTNSFKNLEGTPRHKTQGPSPQTQHMTSNLVNLSFYYHLVPTALSFYVFSIPVVLWREYKTLKSRKEIHYNRAITLS